MGHFIGFDTMSTRYCIYFPDKRQVRIEHKVMFNHDESANMLIWHGEMQHEGERSKTILCTHLSMMTSLTPLTLMAQCSQHPLAHLQMRRNPPATHAQNKDTTGP